MPKYLLEVDYSGQGSAGILSSGGSARRAAVTHMIEELGGSVETFYFTFGIRDCIVVPICPTMCRRWQFLWPLVHRGRWPSKLPC